MTNNIKLHSSFVFSGPRQTRSYQRSDWLFEAVNERFIFSYLSSKSALERIMLLLGKAYHLFLHSNAGGSRALCIIQLEDSVSKSCEHGNSCIKSGIFVQVFNKVKDQ